METQLDEERALLKELLKSGSKTLDSHKAVLQSHQDALKGHETDVTRILESLKNHAEGIGMLRKDMQTMADLVNAQSKVVSALQATMLQVLRHIGMDDSPPTTLN